MRKLLLISIFAFFLCLTFVMADTAYEWYNDTEGTEITNMDADGSTECQTFRVGTVGTNEDFILSYIKVNITKAGSITSININITNVTTGGFPDYTIPTEDETTFDVSALTTTPTVIRVNFTGGATLRADTNYSICLVGISASGSDYIGWRRDTTSPTYVGGMRWFSGDWGESGFSSSATTDFMFEVFGTEALAANTTVNLTYPANNQIISDVNITLNATITPRLNFNNSNATLNVWYSNGSLFNATTNIVMGNVSNDTYWIIYNFTFNTFKYNVYACANNSGGDVDCAWGTNNFTFTASPFSEINFTFTTDVFETSQQNFEININANPDVNSVSAGLWYNGMKYTSTIIDGTAGIYKAINNIDIPLAPADGNKTFLWEFTLSLTGGSSVINSSTYSHAVNRTYLEHCDGTYTIHLINFTTKEAKNPYPNLNASFKSSWNWWLGNGTITRNNSYENVSEANHTFNFCMKADDLNYTTNTQLEFDATGYAQNYHYLSEAILSNQTSATSLYLLNDSDATLTVLTVYDEAQSPLDDVVIQIQLYDVGTDTFYTVGMAKTSFNGEDVVYLNWYDSLYKFVLTKDGEVLKTTEPYKISETPQIFEIITTITFPYDKFEDFIYSLYFNNATNNFVLTFTKPSGLVDYGCLRVIKRNPVNDTQICLTCESSSSATLYCNIAGYGNGTYIATFYATGSLKAIESISQFIGTVSEIYDLIGNTEGSFYAFLFAGIVVAVSFISPVFAVIGAILGVLGAMLMGFQPINYIEFLGIVLLGGIVVWILKK